MWKAKEPFIPWACDQGKWRQQLHLEQSYSADPGSLISLTLNFLFCFLTLYFMNFILQQGISFKAFQCFPGCLPLPKALHLLDLLFIWVWSQSLTLGTAVFGLELGIPLQWVGRRLCALEAGQRYTSAHSIKRHSVPSISTAAPAKNISSFMYVL